MNKYSRIPGVPEKMFLSEIGALHTKEHFFWDTLYICIFQRSVEGAEIFFLVTKVTKVITDMIVWGESVMLGYYNMLITHKYC